MKKVLEKNCRLFITLILCILIFAMNTLPSYAIYSYEYEEENDIVRILKNSSSDEEDDDEIDDETGNKKVQKKPVGHQLYDTEHHNELYGKDNVITAGGGGGMGEGGGAKKNVGGVQSNGVIIANGGTSNSPPVNNSFTENVRGDDAIDETIGYAEDVGEFYKESKGDHAGKKVFEIEENGDFGFDKDKTRISNISGFMRLGIIGFFIIGIISYIFASRDVRRKNSYF